MKRRSFLVRSGIFAGAAGVQLAVQSCLEERCASHAMAGSTLRSGLSPQQILTLKERLAPVFEKKRPPRAGEWLDKHREAGETFAQHLAARRRRRCDLYTTMYVVPLGEFNQSQRLVVAQTAEFMQRFFDMPVKFLEGASLDSLPKHGKREHPVSKAPQALSTHLLTKVLQPRRPQDAVALLGLTASDLWPGEGWNFVLGQASLTDRVGVWSIHRNGDPQKSDAAKTLFLRRTLKTAVHETGHMLGMPHCIAYECGMNGANHLEESDGQPLEFCPECQAKLWWTCGADPQRRVQSLIEFAQEESLPADLPLWQRVSDRLRG